MPLECVSAALRHDMHAARWVHLSGGPWLVAVASTILAAIVVAARWGACFLCQSQKKLVLEPAMVADTGHHSFGPPFCRFFATYANPGKTEKQTSYNDKSNNIKNKKTTNTHNNTKHHNDDDDDDHDHNHDHDYDHDQQHDHGQ